MADVIIYTLRGCSTSTKATNAFVERGIDFEERRVDENKQWWDEATKLGWAVPIIVWPDRVEHGFEGEHG